MRCNCLISVALLVLLLIAWPSPAIGPVDAFARGALTDDDTLSSLLDELGSPARPSAMRRLVRRAFRSGDPSPRLLAVALGRAGGCAALDGATRLLDCRDAEARRAALATIERIGLRSADTARVLAELVVESEGLERLAVLGALGVVGDGRDVDLLLDVAASDVAAERRVAFAALRRLTATQIAPVHERWVWHWRVLRERAGPDLLRALERLEASPRGPAATSLRDEVVRHAWVDLALLDAYLERWLRSEDRAHRVHACALVAALRLADHAPGVVRSRAYAFGADALSREADRALAALGMRERG